MSLVLNLKKRKFLLYFLIFLFVFFITFVVTYICMPLNGDAVWLYGFGYNISEGLIIYRDFNVITTPLYYFIEVIFIKIFGNYLISVDLFNSLLVSLIILMLFDIVGIKSFFVFPLILIFFPNGYNLFSLFWLMLILFLIEKKKENDCLIGLIVGLLFLTKQSVGLCLLFPALFYSKKRFKTIICFILPFLLLSVYLIFNNAFYDFINYCFLGLFDFGTKNNHYYGIIIIFELLILLYLIYNLFKSKFQNKEVFYILMFQILMYPLAETYHFFVSFFPVMYYFFKNKKNIHICFVLGFTIIWFSFCIFFQVDKKVYFEKDLLFLKNSGDLSILMHCFHDYLDGVDNYYFTGHYGYLYKLYYNIPINHYDLWNEGNLGYNGLEKRINEVDELCSNEVCMFIADSTTENEEQNQASKFYYYIKNNYIKVDSYDVFDIYSNVEN